MIVDCGGRLCGLASVIMEVVFDVRTSLVMLQMLEIVVCDSVV